MSRRYSPDLIESVANMEVYRLGMDLAKVCIEANLPAAYVAQVFGTTRMTVHTWFRGGAIRYKKRAKIEVFIQLVEEDIKRGILPANTLSDAMTYLQDMVDSPIEKANAKQAQD